MNRKLKQGVLMSLALILVGVLAACSANKSGGNEAASAAAGNSGSGQKPKAVELLNVSYDPTRELYENYNEAFAAYWEKEKGQKVTIKQSHGGSGKQS
ncbi:MAG: sulfate transporter subunit, partial [Paenibacillaceae bacterium]|nr:sulfate transporter subunit [Paenibacillaceae bacterium]